MAEKKAAAPRAPVPIRPVIVPQVPHIVSRELAAEDWEKLKVAPLSENQHLRPENSAVAVVEVNGQVVATWALLTVPHLDGCWIAPEHRGNVAVVKGLLQAAHDLCQRRGITQALTITQTPEVGVLAEKLGGQKIDGQLWLLPIT